MSRWGKARPQSFTLPLDALVKEKENTNRPIAARSAGTVGKWGITSFTSIRSRPVYGFASFSPKNDSFQFSNISTPRTSIDSQGRLTPNVRSPDAVPVAKPKKFFKSRNAVPEPEPQLPTSSSSAIQNQNHLTYSDYSTFPNYDSPSSLHNADQIKIKINKSLLGKTEPRKPKAPKVKIKPEKVKVEKVKVEKVKVEKVKVEKVKVEKVKPEKVPKIKASRKKPVKESKPAKAPEQPTRVLGRTRKTINYSEDKSRSPSPTRARAAAAANPEASALVTATSIPSELQLNTNAISANTSFDDVRSQFTPESPSKNAEHPPIVLRISKGTSRLISTDSEGINNSPPYLSPQQQQYHHIGGGGGGGAGGSQSVASAAAALVAVLSDERVEEPTNSVIQTLESVPAINNQRTKRTAADKQKGKSEPIKLKLKTPVTNETDATVDATKTIGKRSRAARAAKRNQLAIEPDVEHEPQPGIQQALDSQSELGQRQQLQPILLPVPEQEEYPTVGTSASPQPGSIGYDLYQTLIKSPSDDRDFDSQSSLLGSVGSTQATPVTCPGESYVIQYRSSDATTDQDTSQDSSLVAPPSETDVQLAAMLDRDIYSNQLATFTSPEPEEKEEAVGAVEPQVTTRKRGRPKGAAATIGQKKRGNTKTEITVQAEPEAAQILSPKRNTRARRGAGNTLEEELENLHTSEPEAEIAEPEVTVKKRRKAADSSAEESSTLAISKGLGRRATRAQLAVEPSAETEPHSTGEESVPKIGRASRSKTNGAMLQDKETEIAVPSVQRSYGRKRKQSPVERPESPKSLNVPDSFTENNTVQLPIHTSEPNDGNVNLGYPEPMQTDDTKAGRSRGRRKPFNTNSTAPNGNGADNNIGQQFSVSVPDEDEPMKMGDEEEKPKSVKLVISKKKGSIFKSRAIDVNSGESKTTKRHVYKHKWDDDEDAVKRPVPEPGNDDFGGDPYSDTFDDAIGGTNSSGGSGNSGLSRLTRQNVPYEDSPFDDEPESQATGNCYTRVRNVKRAHQMQEIGEYQEMDDDVEYILESLKSQNPIATRSLAAIQLASKCMTPAFRMHVRAHGTATKFFGALHDATQNQSLGLCTAAIMFVLIQDNLNIDLDKHSLELMLNLLDTDITQKNAGEDSGLTDEQLQRNEQKVIEICREIKNQGKAPHLNLETVSTGTLAMETLLTLTSKRAGEWFKDELRKLGGLEHIINTICECCSQISDYVFDWTETLLEKLRKIERCLRVLENVSERNEDNQKYILNWHDGHVVETLVKFFKLCGSEIELYPTTEKTPTDNPGVVLREALVPIIKVIINLTHTFNHRPLGCVIFGQNKMIYDTCFRLLFQAPKYVPEKCIFELSLLVLLLLINLAMHAPDNRHNIINASTSIDSQYNAETVPAIKAIIEFFYKYEELARFVEQNTDDILNNPDKMDKSKHTSQEDIEETVSTLLQKAGNHMEHTLLASYLCLLVGHLIMDCKTNELQVRGYLRNGKFDEMVQILEKYYNFMNLTASSEAMQVAHMKETKQIIQYLQNSDKHSSNEVETDNIDFNISSSSSSTSMTVPRQTYSASSTSRGLKNDNDYYQSRADHGESNNAFNKLFFSDR